MSSLPDDLYEYVDDNWGSSGVAAAEHVYDLLSADINELEDEVDRLRFERDEVELVRSRVEEAVNILNYV